MFSTLKLIKAACRLRKLKKYIREQNLMILGKKFTHQTKLINILAVEYIFISLLDSKTRKENRETFEVFLKMQAHAILAADLVNEGAEKVCTGCKWKSMNELIQKISKDEPELGKLAKAHWEKANKLLVEIEKKTNAEISKKFNDAVNKGLAYLRKEIEFSDKLAEGQIKFAKSFVKKQFAKDETLAHLTHDRVSVIYTFIIDSFYTLFVKEAEQADFSKEALSEWAVLLSMAMQEGIDDLDDFESDIQNFKPTPVILRMIGRSSFLDGIQNSRVWNMNYLNSLKTLKIPCIFKKLGLRTQKSINKRYRRILRKRKKLEALFLKHFSCLI